MSLVTLQTVGDWSDRIDVPLRNALSASVEMLGRSGRQACEVALVFMAQSARKMTKEAPKNRRVLRKGKVKYVEMYKKDGAVRNHYEWMSRDRGGESAVKNALAPTWDQAKRIRNRGLAQRSWFWGIRDLAGTRGGASKPMPGMSSLTEHVGEEDCGLTLENRLPYIFEAAPRDVESQAARKATDRIMAQVAKKVERRFRTEIPRLAAERRKRAEKRLAAEFRRAAKSGRSAAA